MTQQREAKRQYAGSQPHISSYFPLQSQSQSQPQSQPSYSISTPETTTTIPSLPHNIQSNLLSVGMRVRKSVPEGYKTSTEYSAFKLFSNTSKSAPATPTTGSSPPSAHKTRPRANAGARELQPFCGLLKVGGLNAQQAWGVYSPTHERGEWERYDCHAVDMDELTPDEEDVPALSQGSSNGGDGAAPVARRKRRCGWGEEEDVEDDDSAEENVFRLPSSFVKQERVLAMLRGRKGRKSGMEGQGKVFGVEMDFEDAEFLDYKGLSGEVEMGGV